MEHVIEKKQKLVEWATSSDTITALVLQNLMRPTENWKSYFKSIIKKVKSHKKLKWHFLCPLVQFFVLFFLLTIFHLINQFLFTFKYLISTIRRIKYNFIFKLQDNELLAYLKDQIDSKEKELFLVVSIEVDRNQGWLNEKQVNIECSDVEQNSITYIEDGFISDTGLKNSECEDALNESEHFKNNQNIR